MKQYTTRTGVVQFMPSMELAMEMTDNSEGWCLACGEVQHGVEPDARKYSCVCCGKAKVYGPAELALMGLVH
jgi:hypothetical protein